MARQLFSSSWHSVADLTPRLTSQVRIARHVYRGKVWYVAQDQAGIRYHRMSPSAYALVLKFDGHQTVQQIWEQANLSGLGDDCTQNELVDLLVQLHAADLLQVNVSPDTGALLDRYKKKRWAALKQFLLNPMSLKIPLIDPDRFLLHWAPYMAWCFSKTGLVLWLLVVLPAMIFALEHWSELTNNLSDQILSSSNLLVMAFVFPVVKLVHELGHGFATRVWGGAVHEMGIMFLVFAPMPYVNASSSAAFPSKWQRALVAAAGMMAELLLAALACYVWLLVEPGVVRAVAYNVMIVAGVSTLVVNGNPLLRYDGYYIFSDLIEMPNFAQRGQKYLAYLWDRYVFNVQDLEPPKESRSERWWLAIYTPLAWCYRVSLSLSIALFVAGQFFIFGVLIALWSLFSLIVMPLWKAYRHVVHSPGLQRQRTRAIRVSLILCVGLVGFLLAVPVPLQTRAEGVVWLPDRAIIRAGENGFFQRWLISPGRHVEKGQALFLLEDKLLETEFEIAQAKVAQAQASYQAEQFVDRTKAVVLLRQLQQEEALLSKLEERVQKLVGYAKTDGVLIVENPQNMPGRYFRKGELMGYALKKDMLIARVVVPQDDIDLVRTRLLAVWMRLSDSISQRYAVKPVRWPTGGVNELPTAALGISGGGKIPTQPNDPEGLQTIERIFMVDLALPDDVGTVAFGERVYVRFDHPWEPLGWQGFRRLRQLFLSRFNV